KGFDEQFFLYFEEVDLCKRITNLGYKVVLLPDIEVIHLGGESAKTRKDEDLDPKYLHLSRINDESALKYYKKHHGYLGVWFYFLLMQSWFLLRYLKYTLFCSEKKKMIIKEMLI